MKEVKISYNSDEEMMEIKAGNKVIFYGNYWDFERNPESLQKLFNKMGLQCKIVADLPSIG